VRGWVPDARALPQYAAGTQGPQEADALLLDGHAWRTI
jgi:glucose-6-phosphate 1-dehydrogenase